MYFEYYVLENLIINYLIISCTSALAKKYNPLGRKISGAILGTLYSTAYLFQGFQILFTLPLKILSMVFITYVSFENRSRRDFLSNSVIFFLVNVFICGTAYFAIYFTGISHFKISFLIICAYLSCKLLKYIYRDVKMIKYIESLKKDIKIKLLGNVFDLKALVDSGNMLKDPISKSDVVMVDFKVIKGILPDELVDLSRENLDMVRAQEILMELDTDLSRKIRLIPYKHAGSSEAKIVFGLKIDYLEVDNQKIDNIVIGFADIDDPDYGAIINPSLLQIT